MRISNILLLYSLSFLQLYWEIIKGIFFSSNILTRVLLLLYVYSVYGSCIYMKRSLISSTIVHT